MSNTTISFDTPDDLSEDTFFLECVHVFGTSYMEKLYAKHQEGDYTFLMGVSLALSQIFEAHYLKNQENFPFIISRLFGWPKRKPYGFLTSFEVYQNHAKYGDICGFLLGGAKIQQVGHLHKNSLRVLRTLNEEVVQFIQKLQPDLLKKKHEFYADTRQFLRGFNLTMRKYYLRIDSSKSRMDSLADDAEERYRALVDTLGGDKIKVLAVLSNYDPEDIGIRPLRDATGISCDTLVELVSELESDGFIYRKNHRYSSISVAPFLEAFIDLSLDSAVVPEVTEEAEEVPTTIDVLSRLGAREDLSEELLILMCEGELHVSVHDSGSYMISFIGSKDE